ncbi:efflux RND transporter permease subunit [Methylolobus aquaticus]
MNEPPQIEPPTEPGQAAAGRRAVSPRRSLLAWFAANPVAANLLMALIWLGGAFSIFDIQKDVHPRFTPHRFEIEALYPGAGPLEVETSICVPLEEAVHDLTGVKGINTTVFEGMCRLSVQVLPGYDRQILMGAARGRIQSIPSLPDAVERIDVREASRDGDDGVIWVALYGAAAPLELKRLGERIQADLGALPGVTRTVDYGRTSYEIAVEVIPAKALQYRLSVDEIAQAVRRASLDLAGGAIKTSAGELLLRIKGRANEAEGIGQLVLRTQPDGSRLLLRDVARIRDGLEESRFEWRHNGQTAQGWEVHAERNSIDVARRVKAYVAATAASLPRGIHLKTWWDDSLAFEERIQTLLEDGLAGFLLVCLVLSLFLSTRVALWAGLGIVTSVLGALWWMPILDVSLNMLSLFGFLLAMGILVDDAIIIGESVYSEQQSHPSQPLLAAIRGVRAVALPVTLSVLIALLAFMPGLFLPGWSGQLMRPISLVMLLTLVFSLVEALLILPAHLAVPPRSSTVPTRFERLRTLLNGWLDRFVAVVYVPSLRAALDWRYLSLAGFAVMILLTAALVAGGHVRQSFEADVVKDSFWVRLTVPPRSPPEEIRRLADRVERALFELEGVLQTRLGLTRSDDNPGSAVLIGQETMIWEQEAGFWLELAPEARQRVRVEDFVRDWRRRIGDIGRARIDFMYREGDVPYDIQLNLSAADPETLALGTAEVKGRLGKYPGVFDVMDSASPGKPELRLKLKPEAERIGLRLKDLAEQVRQAYHGEEAQRLQRGRSEVKVMVRYPPEYRRSIDHLYALPITLPDGGSVPLSALADVDFSPGYSQLIRQDRRRVLEVVARVDPELADVNAIYRDLEEAYLPSLRQRLPTLSMDFGQDRQEQDAMLKALLHHTLIALALIYALIAVTFRSYTQPLVFLFAVPVAWCGGILAHWLVGLPLSMESLVGMVAASGVVVNDSLVLLDYIHDNRHRSDDLGALIGEACTARFRPILLAFLTNFAGFLPTLTETSAQAQFLVPMTLSLASGLLFGMAASLLLTPVCYAILADFRVRN